VWDVPELEVGVVLLLVAMMMIRVPNIVAITRRRRWGLEHHGQRQTERHGETSDKRADPSSPFLHDVSVRSEAVVCVPHSPRAPRRVTTPPLVQLGSFLDRKEIDSTYEYPQRCGYSITVAPVLSALLWRQ